MSTLARFGAPLALLAGTVWVIAILIQALAPLSYAWLGLIGSMLLTGGAALGLQAQVGARTGRLGRWGAIATAGGAVTLIALTLFIFVTGQATTSTPPPPILLALSIVTFLAWFIGSIMFALGLMRAKVISPIAGWSIVVGAVCGSALLFAGGQNPSPVLYLPMALYGVGWILVGYTGLMTTRPGVAARAR